MPPRYRRYRRRSRYSNGTIDGHRHRKRRYKKRRKTSTYRDKMRKTSDVNLRLNKRKSKSLRSRVRALEGNQSKHWDTALGGQSQPHKINWNGVTITGVPAPSPRNSFTAMLKVTPVLPDGSVQRYSDKFKGVLENQRSGDSIYAQSLRLRGVLMGKRPRYASLDISGTAPVVTADPPPSQALFTKIWMVVLQDMRPSTEDIDGLSQPTPLENGGTDMSPIESIAQYTYDGISTLKTFGFGQMLRSYESTRFKVHLAKAFTTNVINPNVEFDVTIQINKKLEYVPLSYDAGTTTSSAPLNYNLLVYFLHDTDENGWINEPKILAPEVKFLTSRLKFLDN